MNILDRYAPIWLTAGIVLWFEDMVTIEWSYPYCMSQEDGPAYAALGMPLPYWMWNGVVSLEHDFLPYVYILNVVLLCLLFFPIIRWVWDRVIAGRSPLLRSLIGAVGCILVIGHVALTVLAVSAGYYRPTTSLGLEGYNSYREFRPVRVGLYRSSAADCTPSPFWFPNGWQHN
jgi:hypothetical protein